MIFLLQIFKNDILTFYSASYTNTVDSYPQTVIPAFLIVVVELRYDLPE